MLVGLDCIQCTVHVNRKGEATRQPGRQARRRSSLPLAIYCRRRAGLAQFFPPIKHRPIHIDLYEDLTLGRTDDLIFTAREDALLCIRISLSRSPVGLPFT